MRTALLLLISLCFVGCNSPVSQNTDPIDIVEDEIEELDDLDKFLDSLTPQQQMELLVYVDAMGAWDARGRVEPEPVPPEWLKPYLDEAVPLASKLRSSPVSDGFPTFDPDASLSPNGLLGPDPLAEAQSEPNRLAGSSGSKSSGVWLNYYYDSTHVGWSKQTVWLKGWANKRGLTVANFGEPNFRYAKVRMVDISDPKTLRQITRNLVYDGNSQALFPTLVLVDASGTEVCHNVGSINQHHLDSEYDEHSRTPSRRRMGIAAIPEQEEYRVEDPVTTVCGPNGCRVVRRTK